MRQTLISICICTFQRPHLFKTLASIAKLHLPDEVAIEIIVVNNDPKVDLQQSLAQFAATHNLIVKYDTEPIQNISLARNRSLKLAAGEWIAFIDDDETADSCWIENLYKTARAANADAVIGAVTARFPAGISGWFAKSGLFDKRLPPTGTALAAGRTSNALIAAHLVKVTSHRFDPSYGLTGGGDTLFFQQLHTGGAKIVSCREAIVTERIDQSRLNMRYLIRRALRGGEGYARINYSGLPLAQRLILLPFNVIKMIAFTACALLCAPLGRAQSVPILLRSFVQAGKLRQLLGANPIKIYDQGGS